MTGASSPLQGDEVAHILEGVLELKTLVSVLVAFLLITIFGTSAFSGETKAECEKSGKRWDSKTNTCYSANGY